MIVDVVMAARGTVVVTHVIARRKSNFIQNASFDMRKA